MVFYFSATGNSKYVASRIASELDEEIISITDCIKNNKFTFNIQQDEKIGFVTPTYFLGLPLIVTDFYSKIELLTQDSQTPYIYHVATYGMTSGQSNQITDSNLRKKGLELNARFCVRMPDTWTPSFDLSNKEKVNKTNQKAEKEIEGVIKKIQNNFIGDFSERKTPLFLVKLYYPTYEKKRKTKYFSVESSCIGCGLCEIKCPANAIKMEKNKPNWIKEECILCLGCLHRCPEFSIQYGKSTKKHGQYVNPNVKI